ncbi:MAG: hypothetical protein OK438_01230 [Thaumarchaeota archaeon]|nr:hypothetical protein [Nitrososphaerota archaeon]
MVNVSRRRHRAAVRRALYSLSAVAAVLTIGTIGFHLLEGVSYVDGFYFESMMAAGQGPPFTLYTDSGKIFASTMGFISVITVIASLVFNLLPALGRLWREGLELVEKEARTLEEDLTRKKDRADT